MNEDYCTTFRLAEDIIVIRFVNDYRQVVYRFQYSIQIIWNSRFTWCQIMQHLRELTYHFNFLVELIHMDMQNNYNNIGSKEIFNHSTRGVEIVDGLPDIVICREDNGNEDGVECTVCYETFTDGETVKRMACTHLFHSHCLLQWFRSKISCPTCRYEPAI